MAKVKVDGTALKVVNSITAESAEHGKEQIVRDARERLGAQAFA